MSPKKVAVLVPAAGRGTRLGGERKQLRRLGDASVLVQTLRAFERCVAVGHLIVAGPPGASEALREELEKAELAKLHAVVAGGASRQASVRRALDAAPETATVILVHDAVRPFIAPERIRAVIEAAIQHGAAALAVPASDTLRRVGAEGHATGASTPKARREQSGEQDAEQGGAFFGKTIDRRGCFQMQTPQAFRRALLADAFLQPETAEDVSATGAATDDAATDDVALVQAAGHAVRIVEGDRRNFKITTPADWQLAQALWPVWVASSEIGVPDSSSRS